MKIVDIFSHRNGRDILESPNFSHAFHEFLGVLRQLPPYRAANIKKTSEKHVIAPLKMNDWLTWQLAAERDWESHPLIIDADPQDPSRNSHMRSDFRKSRIEVEVQFGNVARYAYDVYKMAISMALDHADVGMMVVGTKAFAAITGGNIAYYERAVRELERSRLTLIVPLAVVGIEPDTWDLESFPPESEAPIATVAAIKAARAARGALPVEVSEPEEGDQAISLEELRKLVARIA